jgi:hypothetical protein
VGTPRPARVQEQRPATVRLFRGRETLRMEVVWALLIIVVCAVVLPVIAVPLSARGESEPLPRSP